MATYSKPTQVPRWNDSGANNVEPPEAKKTLGWEFEEAPASSWENWKEKLKGEWIKWIDERWDDGATNDILEVQMPLGIDGSTNFILEDASGDPRINYRGIGGDSYQLFDESASQWELWIGGTKQMHANSTGVFINADLEIGDDLVLPGGLIVGYSGSPTDDQIRVGDSAGGFRLMWDGTNPYIYFDTAGGNNDYLVYGRADNLFGFVIAGTGRMELRDTGLRVRNGIHVGDLTTAPTDNDIYAVGTIGAGAGFDATNSGLVNAGAISGATSIDGTGDLTMGSITMTGAIYTTGNIGRDSNDYISFTNNTNMAVNVNGNPELTVGTVGVDFHGNNISAAGNIDGTGDLTVGSITMTGAIDVGAATVDSLNVSSGGITNAGAISGATTIAMGGALSGATDIDGSGDLTVGTITMTGFDVDATGDLTAASLFTAGNLEAQGGGVIGFNGTPIAGSLQVGISSFKLAYENVTDYTGPRVQMLGPSGFRGWGGFYVDSKAGAIAQGYVCFGDYRTDLDQTRPDLAFGTTNQSIQAYLPIGVSSTAQGAGYRYYPTDTIYGSTLDGYIGLGAVYSVGNHDQTWVEFNGENDTYGRVRMTYNRGNQGDLTHWIGLSWNGGNENAASALSRQRFSVDYDGVATIRNRGYSIGTQPPPELRLENWEYSGAGEKRFGFKIEWQTGIAYIRSYEDDGTEGYWMSFSDPNAANPRMVIGSNTHILAGSTNSSQIGSTSLYFANIYGGNVFYKTLATFDTYDDLELVDACEPDPAATPIELEREGNKKTVQPLKRSSLPWPMLGGKDPEGEPFINAGDSVMFLLGAIKQLHAKHKAEVGALRDRLAVLEAALA